MNTIVCTLFEGDYHYGVASLVNSLYKQGFRGNIYAGYKGNLPSWASTAEHNLLLDWPEAKTLYISQDVKLHFLPLTTDYHLTNYKPDFMLSLWQNLAKNVEGLFYFDPDILQVAPWSFMEEWVSTGVAICEDINSPLGNLHPRRVYWRNYYKTYGYFLENKNNIYVNGGFVGVHVRNIDFLILWQKFQELMSSNIGGLNRSGFLNGDPLLVSPFHAFSKTDQDALNATIEAFQGQISFMYKAAMGFEKGTLLIPHALGKEKPWHLNPLKKFLRGNKITNVEKLFWYNSSTPLKIYNDKKIKILKFQIIFFTFLHRFYGK